MEGWDEVGACSSYQETGMNTDIPLPATPSNRLRGGDAEEVHKMMQTVARGEVSSLAV